MAEEKKVVKISGALYDAAQVIAAAQGISIGAAVEEATVAPVCTPAALDAGFRSELRRAGLQAPAKLNWLHGVLDRLPPELLEGTRLEPYARARADAQRKCAKSQADLDAALGQLDAQVEASGEAEVVAGEAVAETSAEVPEAVPSQVG